MNNFRNIYRIILIVILIMIIGSSFYSTFADNDRFLKIAKACKTYLVNNKYHYYQCHYDYPLDASKGHGIDCSGFVSWAIYEYQDGNFEGKTSKWFMNTAKNLYKGKKTDAPKLTKGWKAIKGSENFKPGDILCYPGHVQIYYGISEDNIYQVLNAGGDTSLKTVINSISKGRLDAAKYAIRLPGSIKPCQKRHASFITKSYFSIKQ